MKRLSANVYAQLYYASATGVTDIKQHEVASKFLQLLRRHRALKLLPRIMVHLQQIDDQAHKRTRVAVTAMSADVAPALTKHLTDILGPVVLDLTVDPSLRGGLVLRVGDDEIDGSLRTRLRRLHQHLTHD
jgi:F-type H+-transporting ATPase subunit delta